MAGGGCRGCSPTNIRTQQYMRQTGLPGPRTMVSAWCLLRHTRVWRLPGDSWTNGPNNKYINIYNMYDMTKL